MFEFGSRSRPLRAETRLMILIGHLLYGCKEIGSSSLGGDNFKGAYNRRRFLGPTDVLIGCRILGRSLS
ncbi:hypothetical protein E4U11_004356 [Claviceps purpurea]|nr:hypothetical protein E4U11_004356 [Claviceps purpurea]